MTNQNAILPAIALRGTTILPGMIVHFDVSRERSKKAIEAAMLHDQKIFLVTQIDPEVENPETENAESEKEIKEVDAVESEKAEESEKRESFFQEVKNGFKSFWEKSKKL